MLTLAFVREQSGWLIFGNPRRDNMAVVVLPKKLVCMGGMEWLKLLNLSERSFASMEIQFLKTEIADICKFSSSEGRHSRQLKKWLGFSHYPLGERG